MHPLISMPLFLRLIALPFVLALGAAVGREVRAWHARRQRRADYQRRIAGRLRSIPK